MINNCPMIAIDVAIEEKTRVARMAAATLHKLHDAMQRMKEWREDSVKLKSSIWRMKMVLQADDKVLDNADQRIDPLIAYQKLQIRRLERANDDLENQVTNLKRALSKAEGDVAPVREMGSQIAKIEEEFAHERVRLNDEILSLRTRLRETEEDQTSVALVGDHLKDRLLEFARGDRTMEVILTNVIGRIVETVVGLSEELVYVSENLCRFKMKNGNLHRKLDRLRAMLRAQRGGGMDYRKRVGELSDLAARLLGEMARLKAIRQNANHDEIADVIRQVERSMSDLRNGLKSEREALIAAGDPDCLRYMKKVVDLRVNLRVLSVELRRSCALMREHSLENVRRDDCWRTVSQLNDFLQTIDVEIEQLKVKPIDRYCRIGGMSGRRYVTKIAELEGIVKRSIGAIAALRQDSSGMTDANDGKATDELAESIERLCRKIKDLEVLDDHASLRCRIDRLEASVIRLKLELAARDERIRALNDEHASVRSSLERSRERREKIVADMRAENESLRADINNRKREISELSRKREHSARRASAEMQLMKAEIDAAGKKLRDLHDDREALLRETAGMRNILRGRDKEIVDVLTERDALREKLAAEVGELKAKLEIASDENAKLKSIIESGKDPDGMKSSTAATGEREDERDNSEGTGERARNPRDESERSRAESNESKISPNEANERIDHLRRALNKAVADRTRLEGEISDLKSNEQSLTDRLNVRTSGCEAATRETERVTAENKARSSKVKRLRSEKEQLAAELSALKSEKESLARAIHDVNNERGDLRARISEREAVAESLRCQLERARAELVDASVEVTRLRTENARIVGDLEAESQRNSGVEERVRVLLTEKNELATRINELSGEGVALRERLNKAEAENEYFSIELNKSRLENDRAKATNALLQVTCDKRERDNGALRKERDDTREILNEIGSECRILGNQLRIQRIKYEALRFAAVTALHRENNDCKSRLKKIDTRHPFAEARELGFATAARRNDIKRKRDYSDAACAGIKLQLDELGDAEFKVESDARAAHDNEAKIKDEPKAGQLKSSTSGNTAWRLELADLRSESWQIIGTESACTKGELKNPLVRAGGPNAERVVDSVLARQQVVNICCKSETSDCSSYPNDLPVIVGDEKRWSTMAVIDRLQVENAALKMELDVLRNGLNCSLTDSGKTKAELGRATEEIQALKLELANLRNERAPLRSRLETFKEELNALRSERVALKAELAASRKSNFELRLRANDSRDVHERLKETNARLGNRLRDALRRIHESGEWDETDETTNLGTSVGREREREIVTTSLSN